MSKDRTTVADSDPRSSAELIELILNSDDDDERWNFIGVLHARGSDVEFEIATTLCRSDCPEKRATGADILGRLGWDERTFLSESVRILIDLLKDSEIDVIDSAAVALGHRDEPEAIPDLAALKDHPQAKVRCAVAFGLLGYEDELAVSTLIELSRDADLDTRNYATFGLGALIDIDTPEIIAALLARIGDSDSEVHGEALVGLARRKYPESLSLILNDLQSEWISVLALSAAEELATPELHEVLAKIKQRFADCDNEYFML